MKNNLLLVLLLSTGFLASCGSEPKKEETQVHVHSYSSTIVQGTCKEEGYTLHECSCGDSYKDNYTPKKSTHSGTSKSCSVCGLNYNSYVKNLIKEKGTFVSTKNAYRLTYNGTNYTTHLQYEVSNDSLWLINCYNGAGTMAMFIKDSSWEYTWVYILIISDFYYCDLDSYNNWLLGKINSQDVKFSNRTSSLPYTSKNIVSGLETTASKAAHEQMFIACSSASLILLENKSEVQITNLGFTNWEK